MSKKQRSTLDLVDEKIGKPTEPQSACGPKTCGIALSVPWWKRVPFTYSTIPPLPERSLDDSPLTPEANAGPFSLLLLNWITPLLQLGYVRPLEAVDLWKLAPDHGASVIGHIISESFERRVKEADAFNERLLKGEESPGLKGLWWSIRGVRQKKETEWRTMNGKKRASLAWAINDSVKWWFWSGGLLKVVGDTAQVTSPLVMKALITFAAESYYGHKYGAPVPSIGKGIGLAFVLLAVQVIGSLCSQQYNYRALTTGVLVRGGLITAIYERSLKLSSHARSTLTNGKLVNHISTDVSRIDFCAGFFHASWTALIQLAVCLALLIHTIGVSALAGFATFFIIIPVSVIIIKFAFAARQVTMQWTDKRVKLLQEVLGGMKIVKYFAWEPAILEQITKLRSHEIRGIRKLLLLKAGNISLVIIMPTIATIVGLVTYSLTGHPLDPASIFTALTFFNLLRMPLMFLPLSIHAIVDAKNAINRLQLVFEADLLDSTHETNEDLDNAIEVKGASFNWDAPPHNESNQTEQEGKDKTQRSPKAVKHISPGGEKASSSEHQEKATNVEVFKVNDITMTVPRGKLVAIVGSVGSGKSSLLQGMIGEMKKTSGSVVFGGSVSYCPQVAWVQNATIRENICFGRPFEEQRYWQAIRDACLGPDLDMLPHGDLTEVGEKGVSLSGGQKQRVNICRAIYCDMDIEIFDDPLSALDAHVGKAIFNNVFKKNLARKTRLLVTHALHFLPQVDYIYVINNGRIVEEGTYSEIMNREDGFSRFVAEFGSTERQGPNSQKLDAVAAVNLKDDTRDQQVNGEKTGGDIMQEEERNIGAVSWEVYKIYFQSGRGSLLLVPLLLGLICFNAANVLSSYWLVWWQEDKWQQSPGFYMGILGAFGAVGVVAGFLAGAVFAVFAYFSSQRLHKNVTNRILHAPMSFFDTTPLGRIMNRFSKDIDTIDNVLIDAYRIFINIVGMIMSAIVLVSILIPWFLIAIFVILSTYACVAAFYRASARELKRLDAILRSSLYTHFSESLSGLATIRVYREIDRFRSENQKRVDVENRAYWLTAANQAWLGIRIDFLGSCMTFAVAMLSVGARFSISPAQIGLLISYVMTVQQNFGMIVRQAAEVENSMNAVERINYYAESIEQEAPHTLPNQRPVFPWPAHGRIEIRNLVMRYRPELPTVLKDISFSVQAREKVGIVGRTGAGKSSILTALARLVEPTSGSIIIDDVDIHKIGLDDLRNALSIIPQDPLLFAGTIRTNLDPFGRKDDATLWDSLKRAHLVADPAPTGTLKTALEASSGTSSPVNKLTLDTIIEDEGNNLSVGQRSLVSLARALVKNTKILILDEATASVDYETDRKIQDTIANQFKDRTILCIAHRLRTIIGYDRICVLDAGQIAEFDTPTNLYANPEGIFRGMCDRSSITLEDIAEANANRG